MVRMSAKVVCISPFLPVTVLMIFFTNSVESDIKMAHVEKTNGMASVAHKVIRNTPVFLRLWAGIKRVDGLS
jgi:hypothetical protein